MALLLDSRQPVHFIGVGGIGMSALARILADRGQPVSGSDPRDNATVQNLRGLGVRIFSEQTAASINALLASSDQAPIVVISTAIPDTNPELMRAREKGLDIWHRSDLLAALIEQQPSIAVAGSHGKTTTSTLITTLLLEADQDPTAVIGGIVPSLGSNGHAGQGKLLVAEADESDGSLVKFSPSLGVITNLGERFPKGLQVEVLVTREQNADGMVTISCRALELRKSWDKVKELEKQGKVVQVIVNGFNRGGVTCDLEGLRGFIPRSQLQEGDNHQELVGKTLGVAFIEVNSETRKLVLSQKRAAVAARFQELEVGQLVEGVVAAVKPYGLFIDLGGISGLLHQSSITNGSLRSIREVFDQGERVQALITELDPGRGRIGLNTALLEGPPGELLIEKDKVMAEASDRASRAQSMLKQREQDAG